MLLSCYTFAQESAILNYTSSPNLKFPRLNLGAEIQWYPAGWVYGVRADLYLGKHDNWNFRFAYNDINRKNFSKENDNEVGGGFGGSLGYRYYLGKRKISSIKCQSQILYHVSVFSVSFYAY